METLNQDKAAYRAERVPFHRMDGARFIYCGMGTRLVEIATGREMGVVIGAATRTDLLRQFVWSQSI